jgi:hypothetical protein
MESNTVTYHNWSDIQRAICEEMGMDESYFRNYHKIDGGEYKDLWIIWLDYFDDVKNDTIVTNDLGEMLEIKVEWLTEEGKEWAVPFVEAVYKVWDKYGIENIKYSW